MTPIRRGASFVALLACALPVGAQPVEAPACDTAAPRAAAPSRTTPAVVPVEVSNNHVYVPVCVGGQPLAFILDTGAPESFLDLAVAKRQGLSLGTPFSVHGAGASTVAAAHLARAEASLAGVDLQQRLPTALDLSGIPTREGHRMDGVLGRDFIDRFVVAIDYAARELRLHDRDAFRYDGPGTPLPVKLVAGYPYLEAELRLADGARVRGTFMIDVGSAQTVSLRARWVDEHHLRERTAPTIRQRGGSGVGGAVSYDVGRVAALRLGPLEVERPMVVMHGDSAGVFSDRSSDAGTIGGDVLRRFTTFIDYKRRRFILEPHAATAEPFETDMSGLWLLTDPALSTIVVDDVVPGTPGSEAGLVRGDTIVTVDGRPATGAALNDLRARLRKPGERVELTLRRGGTTRTATLTTRRLV